MHFKKDLIGVCLKGANKEDVGLIIINLGWFLIRQKKKKVKTSVWVSVYMVEEEGIKIENKNTKNVRLR